MAPNTPNGQIVQQSLPVYTREEVSRHKTIDDCWIILHGQVYNVTSWLRKHPGGVRLLMHYAGEDASVSFIEFSAVLFFFGAELNYGWG